MRTVGNDRWTGSFHVDRLRPLGVHDRRRGSTGSRRGATSSGARSRRGQTDLDERAAGGRGAARRCSKLDVETALASTETDRSEATRLVRSLDGRRRPRARALRRLVRALPALVGRLHGRREGAAGARRARLRRRLPPADPPDRARRTARGGTTRSPPGRATRAARGRSAARRAATPRSTPSSGTIEEFDRLVAAARKLGARDRARLRDPVLARPPVAEGAPGVVPPPARRDAQVRREPAQALPGHLQRQLRQRGLARALGGAARRRPLLGRARRAASSASTTRTRSRCRSGSG